MAQQFNAQNIKKRTSVLVFLKGSTAPLVLYVENPEELYTELKQVIKSKKFHLFLIKLLLLQSKKNNIWVNNGL